MSDHVIARFIIITAVLCSLCGDIALGYWLADVAGLGAGGMVSFIVGFGIGVAGALAWQKWGEK